MDGILSDTLGSIYVFVTALAPSIAPYIGAYINDKYGYNYVMDFHMIIVFIIAVFIAFFNCGLDVYQKDKIFREKLDSLA